MMTPTKIPSAVIVNDKPFSVLELNGERVLTTAQIAEMYGTTDKIIRRNFERNKEHYQESKHFYALTGDVLKKFVSDNLTLSKSVKARKMYIWTERGALLHAKSLNTDKAWEVYDFLIENYFRKTKPDLKPIVKRCAEELDEIIKSCEPDRDTVNLANYYKAVSNSAIKQAEYALAKYEELCFLATHPEIKAVLEKEVKV